MATLGIAITPSKSPLEYVKIAQLCEEMGAEYVWVADEIPSAPYRDPFVTLTTLALNTRRVRLGTDITNPYTRHPTHIAAALLSIDEVSNGRAIIGLGPGGSLTLQPLGIKLWDRPLLAIREAVNVLKQLVNGETVDYDGPFMKAVKVRMFRKSKIPIYLAARGEEMLTLAGEVADGVLPTSPIRLLRNHIKLVHKGAKKTGRDISEIDIANTLPFSVSLNENKAREAIKSEITYMVTNLPRSWLEQLDMNENEQETVRRALYRGGIKEARKYVTDKMVDVLGIAGTPQTCANKFKEMISAGTTQVVLSSPFGPHPKEAFDLIKDYVIPKLT